MCFLPTRRDGSNICIVGYKRHLETEEHGSWPLNFEQILHGKLNTRNSETQKFFSNEERRGCDTSLAFDSVHGQLLVFVRCLQKFEMKF